MLCAGVPGVSCLPRALTTGTVCHCMLCCRMYCIDNYDDTMLLDGVFIYFVIPPYLFIILNNTHTHYTIYAITHN